MEHPAIDLKDRTKKFALRVVKVVRSLPQSAEGRLVGNQLLRSGTSVAANYRAVCRARSRPEFLAKLAIVIEETDETELGLEFVVDAGLSYRHEIAGPHIRSQSIGSDLQRLKDHREERCSFNNQQFLRKVS